MMDIGESLRLSLRAITGHKLRSALTTLGIIIGIGSVIVFMVMGSAFMADTTDDLDEEMGPELTVQTQTDADLGFGWQIDTTPVYTERDVEQLSSIDGVEFVAPDGWLGGAQLSSGDQQFTGDMNTRATVPEFFSDADIDGEPFDASHEAVVNEETVEALGPTLEVGENVTATFEDGRQTTFTVTGIVDDGDSGWNARPNVYVPIEPHYSVTVETPRETQERAYPLLEIRTQDTDVLPDVQDEAEEYFTTRSDAQKLTREGHDVRVMSLEDQYERFEDLIDDITVFVAAVAGISLLVGSIGIANIMIVSVTERRREIGIMKAVGARRRDIVQLFLVESLVLGLVGAVLGIVAGLGVGYLAVTLASWPMVYPLDWFTLAVLVGMVVGVLAGIYPSWRGANVDPIEALREE